MGAGVSCDSCRSGGRRGWRRRATSTRRRWGGGDRGRCWGGAKVANRRRVDAVVGDEIAGGFEFIDARFAAHFCWGKRRSQRRGRGDCGGRGCWCDVGVVAEDASAEEEGGGGEDARKGEEAAARALEAPGGGGGEDDAEEGEAGEFGVDADGGRRGGRIQARRGGGRRR